MSSLRNQSALQVTALRTDALAIVEAGYDAINVEAALSQRLVVREEELVLDGVPYPISERRLYVAAVGKCAFAASRALEKLGSTHLAGGIALDVVDPEPYALTTITPYQGTHPLPSGTNVSAATALRTFLSDRTPEDFVLMLISGGGSTLLCLPELPMTAADEEILFKELTARGASIQELNTVRKHTSHARGGALAAACPATMLTLLVSDVPGNDPEYIASAPTLLDPSTIADAKAVLTKYDITPPSTTTFIETPKDTAAFAHVTTTLFLTNKHALHAMQAAAEARGYTTAIMNDQVVGEANNLGRDIVEELHSTPPKTARLYAGESTVTIGGAGGAGGRNQELVLATLEDIHDDELVLAFASDGHDNTDHAGAIADVTTREHAVTHALVPREYLTEHRSYDFFKTSGDALITGYTGSNVSDIILALKK
ncbi:MAG: DUF4147 domain-containing protein [Patescibacteria group bacterium]